MNPVKVEVDLDDLRRRARALDDSACDLSAAAGRWRHALETPWAPSVGAVRDAWEREFAVYDTVLRSWVEAAQAAASAYEAADAEAMR